ncbi:hypothetical protein CRG98_018002 [Punica granatum]|uniref:Uncharacterized protein n=1 Tax=Punica granatum TaxID=22663 RepID=A0A2I0JZ72_PUNGR|nr:hypothetical protein CRG98_018002 [Punica granatum]
MAKGSKDSTSECIVFYLRRGIVSAVPLFVGLGFILCPVSLFETPRLCMIEAALYMPLGWCMLLKPLNVRGRWLRRCWVIRSIVYVFSFVGGVPHHQTSPSLKYEERVRDRFSGGANPCITLHL